MGDSSLWSAGGNNDDQRTRLAELTASTIDPAKDLPLRRDVRSLGVVLGRVLVEQCGESLLAVVEELRRIFIQHRELPRPQAGSPGFNGLNSQYLDSNVSTPTSHLKRRRQHLRAERGQLVCPPTGGQV